jgi:heptosyltransferase-2
MGPGRARGKAHRRKIAQPDPARIRDLTGPDLRNAIRCRARHPDRWHLRPTSLWHCAPLNPIAAVIETTTELACRPGHKPVCRFGHHRCMRNIDVEWVTLATVSALANSAAAEKLNAV